MRAHKTRDVVANARAVYSNIVATKQSLADAIAENDRRSPKNLRMAIAAAKRIGWINPKVAAAMRVRPSPTFCPLCPLSTCLDSSPLSPFVPILLTGGRGDLARVHGHGGLRRCPPRVAAARQTGARIDCVWVRVGDGDRDRDGRHTTFGA
jgi:hypothetical protein